MIPVDIVDAVPDLELWEVAFRVKAGLL